MANLEFEASKWAANIEGATKILSGDKDRFAVWTMYMTTVGYNEPDHLVKMVTQALFPQVDDGKWEEIITQVNYSESLI